MLKEFAKKEKLKDHLLYIIKQDTKNRVGVEAIEPTSEILIRVFNIYEKILKEEGQESAGNYLFNVMASYILVSTHYVLVSTQLIDMNKELIKNNLELIEKLEDKYL